MLFTNLCHKLKYEPINLIYASSVKMIVCNVTNLAS
jgi:hypothetical protein